MGKLRLTLAVSQYDHVNDLRTGEVAPEGIDLVCLNLQIEEIFWRFAKYREWDISEMSWANYVSFRASGDDSLTAIPVFPSRVHRISSIYFREGGGIVTPADLAGKRVGVPEWVQTAGIYARGFLTHECGIALQDIEWYQGGVNQPGREEKSPFILPRGITLTQIRDRTLDEMLAAGELDAIITAHAPDSFGRGQGPGATVRFADVQRLEEEYWRKSGIFPIMHLIAIRADVLRQYPWVATNLYTAFEQAKRRAVRRLFSHTSSQIALAWAPFIAERMREFFPGEYWPYGIEPNRVTLEAFLRYCCEQGICSEPIALQSLFAREVQTVFKV
jgi:4,5-dihydroxyphthalate decarboxylase